MSYNRDEISLSLTRRGVLSSGIAAAFGPIRFLSANTDSELSPTAVRRIESARDVVVDAAGTTAYVAVGDGFVVVDISEPSDPTVLAERREVLSDAEGGPLSWGLDVKVDGGRLLFAGQLDAGTDKEAAAVLFDIGDPANPTRTHVYRTNHAIHNAWVEGTTAYLTGFLVREEPVVVLDVSDEPTEIARWSPLDYDDSWTDVPEPFRPCHDVFARNERLYASYADAGVFVLDVSVPSSPSFVARVGGLSPERLADYSRRDANDIMVDLPGNAHNARPSPDGNVLAVGQETVPHRDDSSPPGGVVLWDIEDITDPGYVTTLAGPDIELPRETIESGLTAHNFAWRGTRLYTSWYQGGVRVYDLADLSNPQLLASWRDPDRAQFFAARPAAEGFVASSATEAESDSGTETSSLQSALYTFPEPDGGGSPAPTRDRVESPWTPTPVRTPTPSPTDSPTATTEPTRTATPTDGDGSGFGVPAALTGGTLALRWLLSGDDG